MINKQSFLNGEQKNLENYEVIEKKEGKQKKGLEESVMFLNNFDFYVFIEQQNMNNDKCGQEQKTT